jgi:hypothetical protein
MFVVVIPVFIIFLLVNTVVLTVMKIQVNQIVPPRDRISWWARDTRNEIGRKYREIFPDSVVPSLGHITGWVCIGLVAVLIGIALFGR